MDDPFQWFADWLLYGLLAISGYAGQGQPVAG